MTCHAKYAGMRPLTLTLHEADLNYLQVAVTPLRIAISGQSQQQSLPLSFKASHHLTTRDSERPDLKHVFTCSTVPELMSTVMAMDFWAIIGVAVDEEAAAVGGY